MAKFPYRATRAPRRITIDNNMVVFVFDVEQRELFHFTCCDVPAASIPSFGSQWVTGDNQLHIWFRVRSGVAPHEFYFAGTV